jgi:SAM-dependent methyltransferase
MEIKNIHTIDCPICGNVIHKNNKVNYINTFFETNLFTNKHILICPRCSFGFVEEKINQEDLDLFYLAQYRSKKTFFRKKTSFFPVIPERAISQWMLINMFHSFENVNNVLDIGTGYGEIFDIAKILFPQSSFYTFEPGKDAQKYLVPKGIYIYEDIFSKNSKVKEKFDIIIMSHVLEHYSGYDVVPVLKNISKHLTDNGILLIEVPYDDFEKIKELRTNDAPHLSFFSINALSNAIKNAGLQLSFINTCGQLISNYYSSSNINIVKRIINKIKKIWKPPKFDYNNPYFRYGGDRIWIRAIVKK